MGTQVLSYPEQAKIHEASEAAVETRTGDLSLVNGTGSPLVVVDIAKSHSTVSALATQTSPGVIEADASDSDLTFRLFDSDHDAILDVQVLDGNTNPIFEDVTEINAVLSGFNDTLSVDLDADTKWKLTGLNEGTLKVGNFNEIRFTSIENLEGSNSATNKDTFILETAGAVTGGIDDRAGFLGIQLFDFFYFSGQLDFQNENGDLVRSDGTEFSGVDYKVLSGAGVNAFVGNGPVTDPARVGLELTNINFTLLLFTDSTGIGYTALSTSGGSASLVGVPDVTFGSSSFEVELNRTSDGSNPNRVLDFNSGGLVGGTPLVPFSGPAIDFEGENGALLNVAGNAIFDASGYVVASGTFAFARTSHQDVDLGINGSAVDVDLLTLDLTGAHLFVGAGARFNGDNTINLDDATGFHVGSADLHLGIATVMDSGSPAIDTRQWIGIAASADGLTEVGLPNDFEITINDLLVQFNSASGNDGSASPMDATEIDWDPLIWSATNPLNDLAGATELAVSGAIRLNLGGYVMVGGSFAIAKTHFEDNAGRNERDSGCGSALD